MVFWDWVLEQLVHSYQWCVCRMLTLENGVCMPLAKAAIGRVPAEGVGSITECLRGQRDSSVQVKLKLGWGTEIRGWAHNMPK